MRLHRDAKLELLRGVPLFATCTKKELEAIAAEADELFLEPGTALTTQGASGREFVVLADGSAEVVRDGEKLNELGAGDFLGEIALLRDTPRTATVTTTSPTRALVLTDAAFRRVTRALPEVEARVRAVLAERLGEPAG